MKKQHMTASTLAIFALMVLATMTGCSKPQPAPVQQKAAEQPEPPPAPKKVSVTFKSSEAPFYLSEHYSAGRIQEFRTQSNKSDDVWTATYDEMNLGNNNQYATLVQDGNIVLTKRIPAEKFSGTEDKSIDLDDSELEALSPDGWVVRPNVRVHAFKSEFADTKTVKVGGDDKTLDELAKSQYPWRITRFGQGFQAEVDNDVLLNGFRPDGVRLFLRRQEELKAGDDLVEAIKDGSVTGLAVEQQIGNFHEYAALFDSMPDAIKGPAIDTLVTIMIPKVTAKADEPSARNAAARVLLDFTWDMVKAMPPTMDSACSNWPDTVADRPVPNYGNLTQKQCMERVDMLKFWARRGQFSFERTKADVAKALGSAPAPATGGIPKKGIPKKGAGK